MRLRIFIALFLTQGFAYGQDSSTQNRPQTPHWTYFAKRLYGEAWDVQKRSIESLKKYPQLENELKIAIESKKQIELAADVIAALKLYNMIDILVSNSRSDPSGHLYLSINSLITSKNRDSLIQLYEARLINEETPLSARVILLDTLGRLKHKLKTSQILNLITQPSYEIQSTTINYIRRLKEQYSTKEMRKFSEDLLNQSWYQTRLQVLYSFPYYFINFEKCKKDNHKTVRQRCLETEAKKDVNW